MSKKMYIVASADNVTTEVSTTDIFVGISAARKALNTIYKDVLADFEKSQIKEKNKTSDSFSILVFGDDLFYGNIKEVKIAEAE